MSKPTNICSACNKEPSVVTWGPHTLCPACAAKFMATMHVRNQDALAEMGRERQERVRAEVETDALRAQLAAANANAERLADAADNVLVMMWGYDENTLNNDVYCVGVTELDALREALKPYMDEPGDLVEEVAECPDPQT